MFFNQIDQYHSFVCWRVGPRSLLETSNPDGESHFSLDQLHQSDNPISLINQSRGSAQTQTLPRCIKKRGAWLQTINSRSSCQICAPQVNDLLVTSYLVLERGVWSLPSPPIKHNRRSSDLLCLSFFGPLVPPQPLILLLCRFCFFWLQREDTQCYLWLCSCFVQPPLSQLLPKVSGRGCCCDLCGTFGVNRNF